MNDTKKLYYKGVNYDNSSYYANHGYCIKYTGEGQTVVAPKCRPIWVHDSLEAANRIHYDKIYSCYVTNVRKPYNTVVTNICAFNKYWELVDSARKAHKNISQVLENSKQLRSLAGAGSGCVHEPDPSTRWANSITLLKQIR